MPVDKADVQGYRASISNTLTPTHVGMRARSMGLRFRTISTLTAFELPTGPDLFQGIGLALILRMAAGAN